MSNTIDLRKKQIENFFNDDLLDFTKFPDEEIRKYLRRRGIIDTTIIKNEENRKAFKELLLSVILINKPYTYKNTSSSFDYVFKLPDFFHTYDFYFLGIVYKKSWKFKKDIYKF